MTDDLPKAGLGVLVGAGPGGAGLLTREGEYWLGRADVVLYDRLADEDLLDLAPAATERIDVGKQPGDHRLTQQQINALLVEKTAAGHLVVRLKGGDPLIFGRGGEEADALGRAGLAFRIVPGVTAASTAAAWAGIPLTDRRCASSVAFVTGHEDPTKDASSLDYRALAGVDTLVIYMGVSRLESIVSALIEAGKDPRTPAAIVEQAGQAAQRVVTATLEELPARAGQAAIAPPAVVIVGPTVALHESLNWVDSLPLHGRCVLVTRSQPQASVLSQTLHRLGAEVIEAPSIRIEPPAQLSGLDAALRDAGGYDWLVLTSPNGVKAVMDRMAAMGMDVRSLAGPKIAVIGRATAERLAAYHITADLVPETFTSQALGDALLARKPTGQRMLLARSDLAPDTLARRLRAAGATVEDIVAYRTVRPQALPTAAADALYANRVDWITFTSSSTVENLLAIKGELDLSTFRLAAIGPVTADALRGVGLEPMVVATPHTIDGLVESIVRWEDDLADA